MPTSISIIDRKERTGVYLVLYPVDRTSYQGRKIPNLNMASEIYDEPATLIVIDDHPLLRRGVRQLLEMEDDLALVFETGSPREGIYQAITLDPDMVLLDLNMPEMDGLETLKHLREEGYAGRVIMYTVSDQ